MKQLLVIFFTTTFLLMMPHRLPAPVSEIPESPSPTIAPKAAPSEPAEPKVKLKKPRPKPAETEASAKRTVPEPARVPVTGTWRGGWDNSRGETGTASINLVEGPNGVITGNADSIAFSPKPPIENGHRSGDAVTFTFRRLGRDYQVALTLSPDGTTLNGEYKVIKNQKLVYTGKYKNFRRR
jgi:hypothetical protein